MNATLKRADAAAIRTSLASASASPPPEAAPFTAEITGCGSDRIFGTRPAINFCTVMPACARPMPWVEGGLAPSPRSSPAQKPRPAPVSTITRQLRSAASSSNASCSPRTSA
jgi:hypothetical protein